MWSMIILASESGEARSSQKLDQDRDERLVRRRHRIGGEVHRPHPFQRLPLPRSHEALPAPAGVERHQEVEALVAVARESERGEAGLAYGDAELLVKLADERVLRALAGLHLSARELPQPGERLSLRALRDEHAVVGIDERDRGDEEEAQAHLSVFMCANAHRVDVRGCTLSRLVGAAHWGSEDPMSITRQSPSLDRFREVSPERRRPSALLVGLGFGIVALAGCASAIVSLAAMH